MALRNTVSDYLIHRLKELGINHAFGVPGDFALDLLDKFVNGNASGEKIEFVNTCNELNGGYAADGYARIKGAGCLVTTYGVGELSAINSIGGCYAERVPVVAITGAPTLACMKRNVPYHHTLGDYKKMLHIFEQVTVASCYLEDAQTAPAEIDRVLTAMMYHKRPVYIAVPQDMVNAECPRPQGKLSVTLEKSDDTSLNKAISEVVQLVQKSQHPIIIGDFEIKRFGLQHKFKELVEKSRIPFAVTALGKGLLNESHPGFLGVYAGAASLPNVKNFVENSDCILIFGNLPSDFNTGKFTEKIPAKKAIIVNLHQISICGKVTEGVTLIDVITRLAKSIPEQTEQSRDFVQACETFPYCASKECGDVKPHDKLTSNHFFHRISTVLPENSIIVAETGNSGFAALDMKFPSGTIFIAQFFYSSIGYSVGAALGASIAAPNRKVFLFIGDGSFQVTAQDISTMIRFRCDVTVFLMNNDGYTTERLIKDGPFNDLLLWNYAKFPAVFGQKEGWCLETVGQLEDCLQHCALRSNFCFVEWKVPRMDLPYVVRRIHDGEKDSSIEKKRARLDAFNVSTLREKLPQRG